MKGSTPTSATFRNSRKGPNRPRANVSDRSGFSAVFVPRSRRRFERERTGFPALGRSRGFTVLELLAVLLIAALVITLAAPAAERLRGSIVKSTERDYILDQFAGLGRQAMLRGRTYVILATSEGAPDGGSAPPPRAGRPSAGSAFGSPSLESIERHEPYVIDLPQGWDIELDEPLVVRANGVCLGAELILRHRGRVEVRIDLRPPYCRIDA